MTLLLGRLRANFLHEDPLMTPSVRTRHLNAWLEQALPGLGYAGLHGFLCARLTGPELPDWRQPLAGLWQDALDEKTTQALASLINELEALADEGQLALPTQCRLSSEDPESVFADEQPLRQWSHGFSLGFACWPRPTDLNHPSTQLRFSLAAELCLFRDRHMAQMLHQAAPDAPALPDFLKRSRQSMKSALNGLLQAEHAEVVTPRRHHATELAIPAEQAERWQGWFEAAAQSRSQQERARLYGLIVDDASTLFDQAALEALGGYAWSEPAARPLLAARASLADCLREQGRFAEAEAHYLALLTLCQDDPLGCRYLLSSLYALTGRWEALAALLERFDEASSWLCFNRALMIFATRGGEAAAPALAEACNANAHVKASLLGSRKLPKEAPESYSPGSRDEAASYAIATREAWLKHGALFWLRQG